MSDLPYVQQRIEVSITGQDATGDQVNFVSADANGNMLVKDYANGSVTGGTAAPSSLLIGGQFNSALPTLTTTQQSAIQLDSSGRILIGSIASALPAGANNIGSITNITGTISLPTGAATSANQSTEITSLQLIDNPVGTVAAGTAGTNSYLMGVIFNTTLPVATTGQQMAAQADLAGRLLVNDTANVSSQFKALSVTTTATLAIGGSTVLANRKAIMITPTNGKVFWGTANTVTTTTGQPLLSGQPLVLNFGPAITVYLIATAITDVRVTEVS